MSSVPTPRAEMKREDPKIGLENMVNQYMIYNSKGSVGNKENELEVRFSAPGRELTRTDYDNVVSHLVGTGYTSQNINGEHMLRVSNMYARADGAQVSSNIRVEIPGMELIQKYCKTNSIKALLETKTVATKVRFTRKMFATHTETGANIQGVNFPEFDFNVSFKTEEDMGVTTPPVQNIINDWDTSKRTFRLINRVRFAHPEVPVFADISIIKSSTAAKNPVRGKKSIPIPVHTLQDAGVLKNPETFEIELELDNSRIGYGTEYTNPNALLAAIRKSIRLILNALRQTAYPIPNTESAQIVAQYARLIYGESSQSVSGYPKFIGPSPVTMQLKHLVDPPAEDRDLSIPCILRNYTVTDKADGERRLLYISDIGKIYLITSAMHVIFTGMGSANPACFNSILDGEFILTNRTGHAIHTFAAFDVYFYGGVDTRGLRLIPDPEKDADLSTAGIKDGETGNCRLRILNHITASLRMRLATSPDYIRETELLLRGAEGGKDKVAASTRARETPLHFRVKAKKFYAGTDRESIFAGCTAILSDDANHVSEYNIDGLIFTPADLGVGASPPGVPATKRSGWQYALKWKPPEMNTIDFLVRVKKDTSGRDVVHSIYQDGLNLAGTTQTQQYKTLILYCGFNKKDGYINPFEDVINDVVVTPGADANTYVAIPFQATHPYDATAYLCNLELKNVPGAHSSTGALMTEDNEPFDDNMIVEFRYDLSAEYGWRWKPIRVRHDKTSAMLAGARQFGNSYDVANDNWTSIHFAVSRDIICGKEDITTLTEGAIGDVYYSNTVRSTLAAGLRDFHNLYVKKNLIMRVCNRGDTLIDYAVGRAGDLAKWTAAKLRFVLGIDIARDGIENKFDGACKRYLDAKSRQGANLPAALFISGNSSLNIKSGDAFTGFGDRNYKVVQAVFGHGPKDPDVIGKGVYAQYGIAAEDNGGGFNVSSCQFAIHYMFENKLTLHNFVRNVAECTRLGGLFIGTCYDGETVFNALAPKPIDGSIAVTKDDKLMMKITKRYTQTGFPPTADGLGLKIDVFQESINQTLSEYLVHYDYLVSVMAAYGFEPLTREESAHMGFTRGSSGRFSDMFDEMMAEPTKNRKLYGNACTMSREEQKISFLNRYFVFRKRTAVDIERVFTIMTAEVQQPSEKPWEEYAAANVLTEEALPLAPVVAEKRVRIKRAPAEI